jgi:hypothetical protein
MTRARRAAAACASTGIVWRARIRAAPASLLAGVAFLAEEHGHAEELGQRCCVGLERAPLAVVDEVDALATREHEIELVARRAAALADGLGLGVLR